MQMTAAISPGRTIFISIGTSIVDRGAETAAGERRIRRTLTRLLFVRGLQRGRDWDEQPPRFARNQGEACGFVETDDSVIFGVNQEREGANLKTVRAHDRIRDERVSQASALKPNINGKTTHEHGGYNRIIREALRHVSR